MVRFFFEPMNLTFDLIIPESFLLFDSSESYVITINRFNCYRKAYLISRIVSNRLRYIINNVFLQCITGINGILSDRFGLSSIGVNHPQNTNIICSY